MIDKEEIVKSGSKAAHKKNNKEQKAHLKTLVENSSVGRARSAGRIVKYGVASFRRNVWLSIAATLVMTVTLIILLVTVGASMILSATAEAMRQKIDITIYFQPGTTTEVLETMANEMRTEDNVKEVTVSDTINEYEIFLTENQDNADLLEALKDDDMREQMLSKMPGVMRIKVYDPDQLDGVKYLADNNSMFIEYRDVEKEPTYDVNRAEIATISSWANIAKNGGLIVGAIFLVISVLVIFNTIRMAIFSRREEIYMMKLVGADPSFIRGPFLVEAQVSGIISGVLATTAAYFGFKYLAGRLTDYGIDVTSVSDFMFTNRLVILYFIVVAVGMLIGTLSARLAIQKYLK